MLVDPDSYGKFSSQKTIKEKQFILQYCIVSRIEEKHRITSRPPKCNKIKNCFRFYEYSCNLKGTHSLREFTIFIVLSTSRDTFLSLCFSLSPSPSSHTLTCSLIIFHFCTHSYFFIPFTPNFSRNSELFLAFDIFIFSFLAFLLFYPPPAQKNRIHYPLQLFIHSK